MCPRRVQARPCAMGQWANMASYSWIVHAVACSLGQGMPLCSPHHSSNDNCDSNTGELAAMRVSGFWRTV